MSLSKANIGSSSRDTVSNMTAASIQTSNASFINYFNQSKTSSSAKLAEAESLKNFSFTKLSQEMQSTMLSAVYLFITTGDDRALNALEVNTEVESYSTINTCFQTNHCRYCLESLLSIAKHSNGTALSSNKLYSKLFNANKIKLTVGFQYLYDLTQDNKNITDEHLDSLVNYYNNDRNKQSLTNNHNMIDLEETIAPTRNTRARSLSTTTYTEAASRTSMGIESKDAAIYEVFDSRIAIDKMKQKIADLELMNNRLKAEEARDLENMKTGLAQFTPMQESDIKIENLRIALAEGREAGELLDMPMITALIKDVTDIRSTHERCN